LGEGWWIPKYTQENHPKLKTVLDILDRPDLFPYAEDSSKGAFVGCPAGWGCQLVNANLFRAFGMKEKGWVLVDPGSAAGLDGSMAKAVERRQNWLGYYWSPTSMIGKYNMQPVDFGVPFIGAEHWDGCIAKSEQECEDPKPSAWTVSEVHTVITDSFKQRDSAAVSYLNNRVFPGDIMNNMLVHMTKNQVGGDDAAIDFLLQYEDTWSQWVDNEIATKVRQSL
jgi:glycine betaine/proline transport system substrate-binding protein